MSSAQESSSSSSWSTMLEADCRQHVLQYLSLPDLLLGYALTCQVHCFEDAAAELWRRRRVLFYESPRPERGQEDSAEEGSNLPATPAGRAVEDAPSSPPSAWSRQQRIQRLFRLIPNGHPLERDLRELVIDLNQSSTTVDPMQQPQSQTQQATDTDSSFPQRLAHWQRCTKAHRLHATLIRQCTTEFGRHSLLLQQQGERQQRQSYVLTLEQYMGYVIAAYVLIMLPTSQYHPQELPQPGDSPDVAWHHHLQQSLQKMEEQGVTNNNINNNNDMNGDLYALTWCQVWIWMHSLFLNVTDLGAKLLAPPTPGGAREENQPSEELPLENWSLISEKLITPNGNPQCLEWVLLNYIKHILFHQFDVRHRTTANQFGPLGPAFRGRDRVESIEGPTDLLIFLWRSGHGNLQDITTINRPLKKFPKRFVRFFCRLDGGVVEGWHCGLWEQCRVTRPMTVAPPMVSIQYRQR